MRHLFVLASGLLLVTTLLAADPPRTYPETKRTDHVDTLHGVKVADPYRWLEDDVRKSTEVADWVTKQNNAARAFLDTIPQRGAIVKRLTDLWNYEKFGIPSKVGGR